MTKLSICLLGPVQILLDEKVAAVFSYNKARALLAYLVIEADRAHQRDTLVGLLWPDLPNDAARTNLRQALVDLRRAIGDATAVPPLLHITRDTVQFNADSTHMLDVVAFQTLLAACSVHPHRHSDRCRLCAARLEQAMALYRGDFLAELPAVDSAPFEEWAVVQRERLHQAALNALAQLVAYHERRGAIEPARRAVARQLELDPWCEETHRTLMRLLALNGQRSAALQQYEVCRRTLANDLDVPPDAQTTALYWGIRDGRIPAVAAVGQVVLQYIDLPFSPTPLVGREAELAELGELLTNRAYRLITLHGPGGSGKTRLALAAAMQHAEAFEHGVAFVSLDATPAVDLIAPAILAALNVPVQGQCLPHEQLLTYLCERELLLVLDSFEHLTAGARLLAELIQRAPRLTLLVTSQTRLALQAEWRFAVHGLSCPPTAGAVDLAQFGAARLLVERIQQVQRMPALSAADEQAVATICRLVAGLPLAIELAAAAIRERSLQEVAVVLAEDSRILSTQWQDAPARHVSVWAILEHAWHLLAPDERHIFSRLAIFRGGFLADAAFAVAGATSPVLLALIDKSLLQRDANGRFSMHELVRPFVAEKLRAAGQAEETERQRLAYFVALAETAEPCLRSAAQDVWLERLELDLGNIRAALRWALAQGDILSAAQLSSALRRFWHRRGHGTEGSAWLNALQDQHAVLPVRVRAKVLYSLGVLAWHQGILSTAYACLTESVTLWRTVNDTGGLAYALSVLGSATDQRGDHGAAVRLLEESQALFRQLDDRWGLALTLFRLGLVRATAGEPDAQAELSASMGFFQTTGDRWGIGLAHFGLGVWACNQEEFALARVHLEQALAMQRAVGDDWLAARTLNFLGETVRSQGEFAQAELCYRQSQSLFHALGAQGQNAIVLHNLGHVALAQGNGEAALALFQQALAVCLEVEHTLGVIRCLEGIAGVLCGCGQHVPAVRLLALITIVCSAATGVITPAYRRVHATMIDNLRAQVDAPVFALAWGEGEQMTLEQAVANTLDGEFWGAA